MVISSLNSVVFMGLYDAKAAESSAWQPPGRPAALRAALAETGEPGGA
jgi:hypothetical protein